ncbi:hypothetical protein EIN_170520 [Entamoeba invadens IP1]|uniref:V-SNARE coiled-coil homology domain-containing protein n=1 Tax=Entamoeba invadens IP1 TaxID=370355 RepID=A0A0A1TVP6_ENTIV|nr:hypothetical protein EIN_170520 [Entamoeba invadens IP1]ELP84527.1 hypothetical protein EIN_170520 [Entamoeba invadens IP1]|eukprot:XP_004183873.1 hypothetical protein EIN_170520 [Entamoeba invadens IP1]
MSSPAAEQPTTLTVPTTTEPPVEQQSEQKTQDGQPVQQVVSPQEKQKAADEEMKKELNEASRKQIELFEKQKAEKEYDAIFYAAIYVKLITVCEAVKEGQRIESHREVANNIIGANFKKNDAEQQKSFVGKKRTVYTLQKNTVIILVVCGYSFPASLSLDTMKKIYNAFYSTFQSGTNNFNDRTVVDAQNFSSFKKSLACFIKDANENSTDPKRKAALASEQCWMTTQESFKAISKRGKQVEQLNQASTVNAYAAVQLNTKMDKLEKAACCELAGKKAKFIIIYAVLGIALVGILVGVVMKFMPKSSSA